MVSGTANKNTMWVNNSGTWVEFNHYDYFEVKKKQNQVSEFEVKIFDISTAQKAYFKEQGEVLFFAGETMILKGRIQSIENSSAFEVIARGYGMEAKLLDKQFISGGDNRIQYTNESAQTIGQAINDGILTEPNEGLWDTDFGNVSLRFEYANRLNALGKLAKTIDYNWWVSQTSSDNYDADYIHLSDSQGEAASQKTYNLTSSMVESKQEKDITNLVNYVYALGYGDGVNQISTSCYVASTQSSFLDTNINATTTSVLVADGSVFDATGSARIASEVITYAGISTNTLTGCSRGQSSTTAKPHNRNCYIEQHYTTDSAQTGSSIQTYGLMDHTLIDKTIIDEETLEVIASGYLSDRKTPILRITITPDEPLADASLNIGDNVTITDSESDINGDYRIVGQTYRSDYGFLSLQTEVSNRSLEFIEQMNKSKQDAEAMAKYMQGSTNIYAISEAENLDSNHPLNMRFYLPEDAVAINTVKLNFRHENWRTYRDYEIYDTDLISPKTIISIGIPDSESLFNVTDSGTATTGSETTLVDSSKNWTTNSYQDYVIKITSGTGSDQIRLINSNSSTIIYPNKEWDTPPYSGSSVYSIIPPYTSSGANEELDITTQVSAIDVGNWCNVKFESVGGGGIGEQHLTDSMWNSIYASGNVHYGQTFTSNGNFNMKTLTLKCHKKGTPGTITVNIYAVDGANEPTGGSLSNQTFNGNILTEDTSGELVEIDMPDYNFVSGEDYCFVVSGGVDLNNWVGVHYDLPGTYSSGNAIRSLDAGASWEQHLNSDTYFDFRGVNIGKVRIEADLHSKIFIESK